MTSDTRTITSITSQIIRSKQHIGKFESWWWWWSFHMRLELPEITLHQEWTYIMTTVTVIIKTSIKRAYLTHSSFSSCCWISLADFAMVISGEWGQMLRQKKKQQLILRGRNCGTLLVEELFTLFVTCHQESWDVSGDHTVCQQDVHELCHISHFLLEDGAVYYKHDGSEEMGDKKTIHEELNSWSTETWLVRYFFFKKKSKIPDVLCHWVIKYCCIFFKILYYCVMSIRLSCPHLAADLNFSRYWGRRLSCPGRSIRVQVLPWTQERQGTAVTLAPHCWMMRKRLKNSPCRF